MAVFVRFIILREILVCKLHANTSFQEKQPLFFWNYDITEQVGKSLNLSLNLSY